MSRCFAIVVAALLWLGAPAFAENRLAFVVGIDAYPALGAQAQLTRAVTDAEAVGDALGSLGFRVTRVTKDATLDTILGAFDRFTRLVEPGDTVMFYYAGHGVSFDDGNYLVPSDVPALGPNDERLAKRHAIAERDIKQGLRRTGARVSIVVLDACRDNPFPAQGTRAIGATTRGLARIDAAEGVYSLYSAREGQSALDHLSGDDPDRNSVFTRVFLKELKSPGVSLSEMGDIVRDEVASLAKADGHEQVPAVSNDLIGARAVFLAGPAATAPSIPVPAPPNPAPIPAVPAPAPGLAADAITWEVIKGTADPSQIETFLARFPQTGLRAEAETRLADLRRAQVAALSPQPPAVRSAVAVDPAPADTVQPRATPSFDCGFARTPAETMICDVPELAAADRRLATAFADARARASIPSELDRSEGLWIKSRDACGSYPSRPEAIGCLADAYRSRIAALGGAEPASVTDQAPVRPSFDCGRARLPVETLICAVPQLAIDDQALAALYVAVKRQASAPAALVAAQSAWRADRNACASLPQRAGVIACVDQAYKRRMAELRAGSP